MGLLNQVSDEDVVLPAIQRDFVWSEEQTETLLDSIMRGYPIGIALLWETYNDIQYRLFERTSGMGRSTPTATTAMAVASRSSWMDNSGSSRCTSPCTANEMAAPCTSMCSAANVGTTSNGSATSSIF